MDQKLEWRRVITFSENTSLEIKRYLRLLVAQGYNPSRVAVVGEDETAFGNDTLNQTNTNSDPNHQCKDDLTSCAPGLSLSYPREIASLRDEYQKEGLMNAQSDKAEYANRQRLLSPDLSETVEQTDDAIKTYSGAQSNLSDEAELLQIVQQLQQNQTQFILLISSNTFDQIFLTRFFRATYPAARVVILSSNGLILRERGAAELRGVLTLSPYPLSPVVQNWASNPGPIERQIFKTEIAQGQYYATRLLLEATGSVDKNTPFLPGYAAPFWIGNGSDGCLPPTWLAVISAGQSWPVAALDERTLASLPGKTLPNKNAPCTALEDRNSLHLSPKQLKGLALRTANKDGRTSSLLNIPMEFRLAVIACLLWVVLQLSLRSNASVVRGPRIRAYFFLTSHWQHPIILNLSWASIGIAVLSLAWCSRFAYGIVSASISYWWAILILLAFVCAGFPIYDWLKNWDDYSSGGMGVSMRSTRIPNAPQSWSLFEKVICEGWIAAFISASVMLAFLASLMIFLPGFNEATTFPEQWRGLHLLSGVSPATPFVILGLGAYLWCFQHLHGLALFNKDEPKLPTKNMLLLHELLPAKPCPKGKSVFTTDDRAELLSMFSANAYEEGRKSGLPLSSFATRRFLLIGLFMIVLVLTLKIHVRDLGTIWYGNIFALALLFFFTVMATEAYQVCTMWQSQHDLLGFLDRVPMRRTMRCIGDFSWNSVWSMGGSVLQSRYRMLSRQIETLRHLQNAWRQHSQGDFGVSHSPAIDSAIESAQIELRCEFAPWFSKHYNCQERVDLAPAGRMQDSIASVTSALMLHILLPAWQSEQKSLILNNHADRKSQETEGTSPVSLVQIAEEFVCLNYLAFIQNMMGRIRTLVVGMTMLFLTTAFACSTYPFDPQPLLGFVFSLAFIVLAATVITVYAQAHRDATLSNITRTTPGDLGGDFYLKVLQFVLGPAIGLISVMYPSISNFLFTWLQPGQMK